MKVTVDGREFVADPAEKRDFDAALEIFRKSEFAPAQNAFLEFARRYPQSGYLPSALFWLGNAQYATRDYKEAITNFRLMLSRAPDHARAPEAALSIANCQIELKDTRAARRTLDDLIKAYPQSEAAAAGKDRLARLR
jgi:tol-pal system protein YbgF